MTALPVPWMRPPSGAWTLADVQRLPERSRVEVLDGALIVNPSPLPLHQRMVRRLAAQLEPQLPGMWTLETDVDVLIGEEPLDYLTPDLVIFRSTVPLTTRPIRAEDVLLVAEVVSAGSRREDRGSKPLAYADAGISSYWRLESPLSGTGQATLHAHHLDSGAYRETGRWTGSATPSQPFPAVLDLNALMI